MGFLGVVGGVAVDFAVVLLLVVDAFVPVLLRRRTTFFFGVGAFACFGCNGSMDTSFR